jgi:hypothetical protein
MRFISGGGRHDPQYAGRAGVGDSKHDVQHVSAHLTHPHGRPNYLCISKVNASHLNHPFSNVHIKYILYQQIDLIWYYTEALNFIFP